MLCIDRRLFQTRRALRETPTVTIHYKYPATLMQPARQESGILESTSCSKAAWKLQSGIIIDGAVSAGSLYNPVDVLQAVDVFEVFCIIGYEGIVVNQTEGRNE